MVFDFSENVLTDASIRSFAELLKKFQGFSSIKMSDLSQKPSKKDTGFQELAKALRENTSLVSIDLTKNQIGEESLAKLA